MFKKFLLLMMLAAPFVRADQGVASYDTYGVKPVAENDGDTLATFKVTLDSFTPVLIDAGNVINTTTTTTIPSLRRRTIRNTSNIIVYVSSAAAFNSVFAGFGYILGESTSSIANNTYQTWFTGPIYGACLTGNVSCTVSVAKETISQP